MPMELNSLSGLAIVGTKGRCQRHEVLKSALLNDDRLVVTFWHTVLGRHNVTKHRMVVMEKRTDPRINDEFFVPIFETTY